MNTTGLIRHWHMNDALHDVHGRFRAVDDIAAMIDDDQPTSEPTRPVEASFLIKGAGESGWQPLSD